MARNAEVMSIDALKPDEKMMAHAAQLIMEGQLVVMPTETRYGLIARADQPDTVLKLYRLKKRSTTSPTAIFIEDYNRFDAYGIRSSITDALASAFLPGPMTIVTRAVIEWKPPLVVQGRIGIRISSAPAIGSLLSCLSVPVTATSANISGSLESETVDGILETFGDSIGLYIDAGRLGGKPSTVVDCTGAVPKIVREGAISAGRIREVTGKTG
jgi:L-threonylcarbamoyladenylate synthase